MLKLVHDGSDSDANGVAALGSSLLDNRPRWRASDAGCGIAGRGRRPGDDIHAQLPIPSTKTPIDPSPKLVSSIVQMFGRSGGVLM